MAKTEIDSKAAEAVNEEQVKETETQAEAEAVKEKEASSDTADFTRRLRAAHQISGKEKPTCHSADSDCVLCRAPYRRNLWSYMAGH